MVNKYTEEDIEEINALGKELNNDFKELFHISSLNKNEEIYTYKENNELIGFIHIYNGIDVIDILNFIIKKNHRNKGIGAILLDNVITSLYNTNKKIMLEVKSDNPAIHLYEKFNFEIVNTRKNYYNNKDAIIMERKI